MKLKFLIFLVNITIFTHIPEQETFIKQIYKYHKISKKTMYALINKINKLSNNKPVLFFIGDVKNSDLYKIEYGYISLASLNDLKINLNKRFKYFSFDIENRIVIEWSNISHWINQN